MIVAVNLSAKQAASGCDAPRDKYDFRTHEEYGKLTEDQRQRLEQAHRDFALLWGALDMFADAHDGQPPQSLDELTPLYLRELPQDPFATEQSAKADHRGYLKSLEGWGYGYRKGTPGNRAWCLASVGLPEFPYLAERGNISVGTCKGTWISGMNPMAVPAGDEE